MAKGRIAQPSKCSILKFSSPARANRRLVNAGSDACPTNNINLTHIYNLLLTNIKTGHVHGTHSPGGGLMW